ncbi:MAG TPA: flagellar motor protein MotB [Sphingobium sp.]|uniref:flagellar motor protein MotB n=1 Tax=Sphingobium sp. TaxID=1912891 RepID=UPI002ED0A8A8
MAGNTPQDELAPIIIRKVRRSKKAVHHGGAWKVAYADFVTAMMAFFMLLWLISNPNKAQLKGLAEYFSPAPAKDAPAQTTTNQPGDQPGIGGHGRQAQSTSDKAIGQPTAEAGVAGASRGGTADVPEAALRVLADELTVALERPIDTPDSNRSVKVEKVEEGIRVHLMDSANRTMFKGATAELNPYARQLLARLAGKLVKTGAEVAIRGHTDATGGQSLANWQLSANRALAARAAMVDAGLSPDHFAEVVAKAGTEPIYPDHPERPENRRITIVITGAQSALPRDASFTF